MIGTRLVPNLSVNNIFSFWSIHRVLIVSGQFLKKKKDFEIVKRNKTEKKNVT